jgi:hypothetical protein
LVHLSLDIKSMTDLIRLLEGEGNKGITSTCINTGSMMTNIEAFLTNILIDCFAH